jgi:hypothetical protein
MMDTESVLLITVGAVLGWVGSFLTQTYQAWLNRREAVRQQRLATETELRKIQLPTAEETRKITASRYGPLLGVTGASLVAILIKNKLDPTVGASAVVENTALLWFLLGLVLVFGTIEARRWLKAAMYM